MGAKKQGEDLWKATSEAEKKMKEIQDEEEKKKADEEAKNSEPEDDEDADDEDEDADDKEDADEPRTNFNSENSQKRLGFNLTMDTVNCQSYKIEANSFYETIR